jgi:zinc transport system permease protein
VTITYMRQEAIDDSVERGMIAEFEEQYPWITVEIMNVPAMETYNKLLLTSVDSFLARSRGIRTRLVECVFVVMVAVAVMLSIRWVGVMLINALLILPAAAGRNLARSARQHAAWSVLIALLCGLVGLTLSYYLDTSAGASIVLVSALCYAISLAVRSLRK